ncbi:MAG TPA: hypothetical protein VE344_02360 [Methylomirabilota bacterium]|nr:hypothetical protein [Methylomirabilota bacterium]
MSRKKRDKDQQRFYLLPGQGGRAHRRKQKFILAWSAIVAFIIAAILATAMYFINRAGMGR